MKTIVDEMNINIKWGLLYLRAKVHHHILRRSVVDRVAGWLVTALLLLFIYVLSAWSDVSTGNYANRIITFSNTVSSPPPAPSSAPAVETVATPPPVPVTLPKRVEISLGNIHTKPTPPTLSRTRVDPNKAVPRSILSPKMEPPTLESRRRAPVTSGIRRRVPRGLSSQATLPPARPSIEVISTDPLDIEVPETDVPEIREDVIVPDVRVFDESTLSTESEETKSITRWVIRNHKDIPTVVQRHMDFEDGDKTAGVTFVVDGVDVQIFLMVRSGYEQLHILLVSDNQSYLYVNRGMRDQASRFRVGRVTRHSGQLAQIASQERTISSDESSQFYTIFTDWWNTTKP